MQHKLFLLVFVFLLACKSKPPAVEALPIPEATPAPVDRANVSINIRDLQNSIYTLEDKIYGSKKLATLGLYGELKSCRRKLASPQLGGTGAMTWGEPLDRLTDKEDEFKGGSEDDRLQRFYKFKSILDRREADFVAQIEACQAQLAEKVLDESQPNRVAVTDLPKAGLEREEINRFLCSFVKSGASLEAFLHHGLAKGWFALGDFRMTQNLTGVALKDTKGVSKDNALLFNGWKLVFDRSPVTVGELFSDAKDARLMAWAFDKKADVPDSSDCLKAEDGRWNP